jgi:hypothetical protein
MMMMMMMKTNDNRERIPALIYTKKQDYWQNKGYTIKEDWRKQCTLTYTCITENWKKNNLIRQASKKHIHKHFMKLMKKYVITLLQVEVYMKKYLCISDTHTHTIFLLNWINDNLEGANNSIITLYLSIYANTFFSSSSLLLLSAQGGSVMSVL